MAEIVVRDLDEAVVEALRRKANDHGRSLEAEVRAVLTETAGVDREEFRRRTAAFRLKHGPQPAPDSVEMIREDRDR